MLLATLATTAARGARQVCGQKGKCFICLSIENYHLSMCLNPCEGLSNKIMLNYFTYSREICSKLNFLHLFLKFEFLQNVYYGSPYYFFFHRPVSLLWLPLLWPKWPEAPPEPWSEVLAAKVLDVVVMEGLGLGGRELVLDPWPWFMIGPLVVAGRLAAS